MDERSAAYLDTLHGLLRRSECTDSGGAGLGLEEAVLRVGELARHVHAAGNRLMFVGNGGSASICSHMAADYSKNGGLRSIAFNDSSVLTCLGNDLGYENVFAAQIEWHAQAGDLLVAISSSGRSPNILKAVGAARAAQCKVVTFSGFADDNPLRTMGDINIYIRSQEYSFVEVGHLTLIHAILDLHRGWVPAQAGRQRAMTVA
ncbi:MAG: SIS domain-containing protein [Rhodospirillaceae bacterium]|nr:SIS domain-containing protein [Rhodospirillaceae bacterium]